MRMQNISSIDKKSRDGGHFKDLFTYVNFLF